MRLQVIKDGDGQNMGVFVPIKDWNEIVREHADLGALVNIESPPEGKLSQLAGKLSRRTAAQMQDYVAGSRNEWEER